MVEREVSRRIAAPGRDQRHNLGVAQATRANVKLDGCGGHASFSHSSYGSNSARRHVGNVVRGVLWRRCCGARKVAQYLTAYYPNNFLQAISDGVVLFALLCVVWLKPRKPGVITGWFVLGYGSLRLATEVLREIDPGVLMIGPATLPMLLSMLMMLIGAVICVASSRRNISPMGGLVWRN